MPNRRSQSRVFHFSLFSLFFVLLVFAGAVLAADSDVLLTVRSRGHETKLTRRDIAGLPHQSAKAKENGKESVFEGVLLRDVLARAGVKFGDPLRGKALLDYLVVEASDGYSAVFALPELDDTFTDTVVLLADARDGKPLGSADGPLRIIVPHEKRISRWARHVTTLRIVTAPGASSAKK